jgi:hypothetical protein
MIGAAGYQVYMAAGEIFERLKVLAEKIDRTASSVARLRVQVESSTQPIQLACPREIDSHTAFVTGTVAPEYVKSGAWRIAVYVSPDDAHGNHWLQHSQAVSDTTWGYVGTFGNPYGLLHSRPLPTDFRVYAILWQGPGDEPPIGDRDPKDDEDPRVDPEFETRLRKSKLRHAKCTITRQMEPELRCQRRQPILEFPPNLGCTITPTRQFSSAECDITTRIARVHGPLRPRWASGNRLWLEIRKEGKLVASGNFPSDHAFNLEGGFYELKARFVEQDDCATSVWAQVEERVALGAHP